MVALSNHDECREAEVYYMELLDETSMQQVPRDILQHIRTCSRCRTRLHELREIADCTTPNARSQDEAIAYMLRLHLAYTGLPITCGQVKPFLATMADVDLEIHTPTPITVHIDNCTQCQNDLNAIREMNLNRRQLKHLSHLLSLSVNSDSHPIDSHVLDHVALLEFEQLSAADFEKLSNGIDWCRQVHNNRRQLIEALADIQSSPGLYCLGITDSDLFDCVLPDASLIEDDRYEAFKKPLVNHLRRCPHCLKRMQNLHAILMTVLQRPQSDVVTTFEASEQDKESEGLYAGYPVHVSVTSKSDMPQTEIQAPLRRRRSVATLPRIAAIAACLVIGIGVFLFNSRPAEALSLKQLAENMDKALYVHSVQYDHEDNRVVNEKLKSKALGIFAIRNDSGTVLYDIEAGRMRVRNDNGSLKQTSLAGSDEWNQAKAFVSNSQYVMPLAVTNPRLSNVELTEAVPHNVTLDGRPVAVYELTWGDESNDTRQQRERLLIFLDPQKSLPVKTELYQKLAFQPDFVLLSTNTIEYLSEAQFRQQLAKMGF